MSDEVSFGTEAEVAEDWIDGFRAAVLGAPMSIKKSPMGILSTWGSGWAAGVQALHQARQTAEAHAKLVIAHRGRNEPG